ncbi:unnamed protein product [Sphagnum compactum]
MISEILSQPHVFTFSIMGDDSTHYESSYFDIHIRVGINGVLHNLHLAIVLFYGCHTAVNILALIVKILDVLFLMWCNKLISVSSDDKNTMTDHHGGLVTLLKKEATNNILPTRPAEPNHRYGWREMPQGHNAVGGVWEDAQMVSPSPLSAAAVHRGEATNPSSVASMVDPVRCGHPIVRNDAGHVRQAAMPRPGDVSADGKNRNVLMMEAPPIMPAQLVHLRPRDFIHNILDPRRAHLSKFWSPGEIEDVEQDHMKLDKDYGVKIQLKQNIDA